MKEKNVKTYEEFLQKYQDQFDKSFGKYWFAAYSNEQFREGMAALKLTYPEDARKLITPGDGTYILREKEQECMDMIEAEKAEFSRLIQDDDFCLDGMLYELGSMEYNWQVYNIGEGDADRNILDKTNFGYDRVMADPRLRRLWAKAKREYFGIEGVPVDDETRYYIDMRETDPTYTVGDAMKEYLRDHEDIAVGIAQQYWTENDPDSQVFDWDAFEEIITSMSPMDAFKAGYFAEPGTLEDDKIGIDGYGNFYGMTNSQYIEKCMHAAISEDCINLIIDGKISIPERMGMIIGMFIEDKGLLATYSKKMKKTVRNGRMTKSPSVHSTSRKASSKGKNVPSVRPIPRSRKSVKKPVFKSKRIKPMLGKKRCH